MIGEISKEWQGIPFRLPDTSVTSNQWTPETIALAGVFGVVIVALLAYGIGYFNGDKDRQGDYDRGYGHGRELGRQEGKKEGADKVRNGEWI